MSIEDIIRGRLAGYDPVFLAATGGLSQSAVLAAAQGLNSPVMEALYRAQREAEFTRVPLPGAEVLAAARQAQAIWDEQARWRQLMGAPSIFEDAQRAAELAQSLVLPNALTAYRTPMDTLSEQLALAASPNLFREPAYLQAFGEASALANLFTETDRVTREISEIGRALWSAPVEIDSLGAYRGLLDGAGLTLPHWPRLRLLSQADKRRRLRARINANAEPSHVKRAKSLVHRYELTLRELIDDVMADLYGEDWPETRLPLCDCEDLLGKWRKRGGMVLDHADYAHYERIISHPEHFEAIFCAGFVDAEETVDLFKRAGRLRAASHHAQAFSPEDLRDLRVTWRTIETGLLALVGDYDFDG